LRSARGTVTEVTPARLATSASVARRGFVAIIEKSLSSFPVFLPPLEPVPGNRSHGGAGANRLNRGDWSQVSVRDAIT
jgi:hypothetical protein